MASRFGPLPQHPVLDRVRAVADAVLLPGAATTDAGDVPAEHVAALTAAGLAGLGLPAEFGGRPVAREVLAEAYEIVAGACPSTHLVVSQHQAPAQWLLDSGNAALRAELVPELAAGRRLGGAAFGHVRSWPRRAAVTARREPRGWRFTGTAPWFSGAGLVDLVALAAVDPAGRRIVHAVIDLPDDRAVPSPLALAAVGGSRTVALRLADLWVPDGRVTHVVDVDEWHAGDAARGGTAYPGAIGLARAAIEDASIRHPDDPSLDALAGEIARLRAVEAPEDPARWRVYSANLAVRATTAAIVARGGSAFRSADIAQIRARAALFLHVRGLSDELRQAHFRQLADPNPIASIGVPD